MAGGGGRELVERGEGRGEDLEGVEVEVEWEGRGGKWRQVGVGVCLVVWE